MKTKKGFTLVELIFCIVVAGFLVILFFTEKQNVEAMQRDDQRKTAINAMFYALEEGFLAENGHYPEYIESAETLRWIDPNLFTDPNGVNLWDKDAKSDYSYEAYDCKDGGCQGYTLRARMEKEGEFVKNSRK